MQALCLDVAHATVRFRDDYPRPCPAAGEALIRVHRAGICATDLELARGYMAFAGVPGHEFVGTVIEGPEALRNQRVVAEINCPCDTCALCRGDLGNHCPQRTVLGIAGRDGAFAQYLTIPAANCHRVPDELTDEQAVFVEPLAAAAQVLDATPIGPTTRVTLLGTGRLGLLAAQVLATTGCVLRVIGRNPQTLAWCRAHGLSATALSDVQPAADQDVIVECTGHPDGLRLAVQLCRPCGTIVLKSTYAAPGLFDLAPLVINEIRVVGSRCGRFEPALALLHAGRIDVTSLVTAEYSLAEGAAAFATAADPGHIKVLLRMPASP